jgi:uncharacterized Zn finger protein
MMDRQSEQSCPRCRLQMRRVRAVPKQDDLPELIVYRCNKCGRVETVEYKPLESDDR